jgi:glyoxylase-like metal-dependent hydrolase (beta-lactamase superfamily II)
MHNKNFTCLTVGPIETNCYIYPLDDDRAAVIDPGGEADRIISTLKKLNLVPSFILHTHGHFDHIAAMPELAAAYNSVKPSTPAESDSSFIIAIHRLDSEYIGPDAYKSHRLSAKAAMGNASFIDAFWPDAKQGLPSGRLLEEGDTVGPFTVLHLPGHTRGSIAFWDKEAGNLFTGDTLFEGDYGRTDLPGGNEQEIIASLRRLFTMDENIKVFPGHGPSTTIGREARGLRI